MENGYLTRERKRRVCGAVPSNCSMPNKLERIGVGVALSLSLKICLTLSPSLSKHLHLHLPEAGAASFGLLDSWDPYAHSSSLLSIFLLITFLLFHFFNP